MGYYGKQLRALYAQMQEKKSLQVKLTELRAQQRSLHNKVFDLEHKMKDERSHVDRLESNTFAAIFYRLAGKLEQKLDKERAEYYAAKVNHQGALRSLVALEHDIDDLQNQVNALDDCEEEYHAVYAQKVEAIKQLDDANALEILQLEGKIAQADSQKRELEEAIVAGSSAVAQARIALADMDSAESWATYDLVMGGIVATAIKHGRLDDAQADIQKLQIELRRFKVELADVRQVQQDADLKVTIDGFLGFADYFFDNLFVDWAVLEQISESRTRIESVKEQIEEINDTLSAMLKQVKTDLKQDTEALKNKVESIVL